MRTISIFGIGPFARLEAGTQSYGQLKPEAIHSTKLSAKQLSIILGDMIGENVGIVCQNTRRGLKTSSLIKYALINSENYNSVNPIEFIVDWLKPDVQVLEAVEEMDAIINREADTIYRHRSLDDVVMTVDMPDAIPLIREIVDNYLDAKIHEDIMLAAEQKDYIGHVIFCEKDEDGFVKVKPIFARNITDTD